MYLKILKKRLLEELQIVEKKKAVFAGLSRQDGLVALGNLLLFAAHLAARGEPKEAQKKKDRK